MGIDSSGLNDAQQRVVDHDGGPLLVVAGAGTGKTMTLAARVAALLRRGVPPERVLLLTFTRRAAAEMLARAARLGQDEAAERVWGGTFHAVAHRVLRMHAAALGLAPGFSVIDQSDAADLMALVRGEHAGQDRRFPRGPTLAAIYSRVVGAQEPLHDVLDRDFPWCVRDAEAIGTVFTAYTERKRAQALFDFDDLLLWWRAALLTPRLGSVIADSFDHVLVDEYQDVNAVQVDIVRGLRQQRDDVMAVGDDAQAIYGFRAASPRHILEFPQQFPGTTVVALEENYRSTAPVLAVANAVMERATEGYPKTLWSRRPGGQRPVLVTCADEAAQSVAVCQELLARHEEGLALREQAVLFRAGWHSDALEVELGRRNIPFVKYGGMRFLQAAHVKDLLALLRIVENPYDELAWFRVLQLLDGVGAAGGRRILSELGIRPASASPGPLERLAARLPAVPASARGELEVLRDALMACEGQAALSPAAQTERLSTALTPLLRRAYDHVEPRLRDLEALVGLAAGQTSRARLIADLTLDPPAGTSDHAGPPGLDEDYVVLSTVHSAKGGEWRAVHVLHATDGMFPSDMALRDAEGIEEERRLFYVAVTRARSDLLVYFPQRFHHHRGRLDDAHGYAQLTRFLPPDVLELFHRRTAGSVAPADPEPAVLAGVATVDVGLHALWGG